MQPAAYSKKKTILSKDLKVNMNSGLWWIEIHDPAYSTGGHTVQTTDNKLWGLISWASSQAIL